METEDKNIMALYAMKPPFQVSLGGSSFQHQTEENVTLKQLTSRLLIWDH
jgi:hypothetical protein